jgi:hypothetical protein
MTPPKDEQQIARPYKIIVQWVDGLSEEFEARGHVETEYAVTIYLNSGRLREFLIPYANMKKIEIDRG